MVAVTEALSPAAMTWLRAQCTVVQAAPDTAPFANHAAQLEGLVVRTLTRVDHELLRALPLKPPRLLEECEPRMLPLRAPPPPAPLFDRRAIPSPRTENRENRTIVRANAGLRKK